MREFYLDTKTLRENAQDLKAGDKVYLSGTVYTARDAAHKRMFSLLENGKPLPFNIENSVIYYAGPTPTPKGKIIGSVGPTTSGRMDKFAPSLYDLGVIATIGKGERNPEVIEALHAKGITTQEVTLHVGAGTFLPVKEEDATKHTMHTEHFTIELATLRQLREKLGHIISVGTTSTRTIESLSALGWRVLQSGSPEAERAVGQWEIYDIPAEVSTHELLTALAEWMERQGTESLSAATQIMITPHYRFRIISGLVTNFHQPKSTLLLLISAIVGERWRDIYGYAMANGFRFLSYGDSSLLFVPEKF
jgi:tartrate/fumarate subfamily iron-sulfur-dependent hydro-lyase beta chain